MSSWKQVWILAFWLVIHITSPVFATSFSTEGDFAFDVNDEFQAEISHKSDGECPIKRLWGVPDMPAYVGRVFKLQIPNEAFSGKISGFKASGVERSLPSWLTLDGSKGLLRGIPEAKDFGEHRLIVTALPFSNYSTKCPIATDTFTIEVKDKSELPSLGADVMEQCHLGEDETRLFIVIDRPLHQISTKQKLFAITKLAAFMGLDYNAFSIQSHESKDEKSERDVILMSGLGDKKINHKSSTAIQLVVGCSGKLWHKHSILVHQMKEQARDGSISYVIRLPVTSWKVVRHKQVRLIRKQRASFNEYEGSTYDDDEDYSGYDATEEYVVDDDNDKDVEPRAPYLPPPPTPNPTTPPEHPHPHRHHHGEVYVATTPETETTSKKQTNEKHTTDVLSTLDTYISISTTTPTMETTHIASEIPSFTPTSTSVVSIPDITLPAEITTLDDTSQMGTETSTFLLSSRNNSEMTRPTTVAMSPTLEVSTLESPTTPLATPVTQPVSEDTATTIFATTLNANSVQENEFNGGKQSSINTTESDSINEIITDKTINHPLLSVPEIESINISKSNTYDVFEIPSTIESITDTSVKSSPTILFDVDTTINNNISDARDITFEVSSPISKDTTTIDYITTERSSTVIGRTTETVLFTFAANLPPQIQHRNKKVAVTAGKAFSYIIPEDLFIDKEDGTSLKLAMYDSEHQPLKSTSWVQFNPQSREVYGLPLEEHVSKWEYIVEATDSNGASANDTLDITVQQHKGRRTVNHEFSLKLRMLKKYASAADWQIRVLKGLVNLFRDTDMDQITVRDVDINSDPVEFIWTNDTLPRNYCPKNDIDRLMGILQTNSEGDPSPALISAMAPELRVKSVAWRGTGACQAPPSTPVAPALPNLPDNFSPIPRNQIDQLNAQIGKLLVYKVPDDTFYDPEDGSTGNLKMWLTRGDRSPIPAHNWLQFDTKNQEFYGIPLERDKGRRDYQLVCEDSGGLTANDGIIVEVRSGPQIHPTVEFRMTIDIQYDSFMQSAASKRKFIEKLHHLFNDKDASSIKIKSITDTPTIISWYNVSLPTDRCPDEEIKQLKKVLIRENEGSLTERVDEIMGPEFTVMSVSFDSKGACAIGIPIVAAPEMPPNIAGSNEDASKTVDSDDYIITFIIPIVVIVCMIVIAALIACILYRRRRSGKMSVGDDEERQAFRSKGIPVIFQDELDEKPDPSNKTPVIMKEEKPPLLPPPEYKDVNSSSPTPSHTPYHPPPPFTAPRENARNSRPKPTPAYRKPPPYVPP